MKTTIDLPDDLYRRVKAKAAIEGRAIREVTMELYRQWLAADAAPVERPSPEDWIEAWTQLGEASLRAAPPGPSATEVLEADRRRLEGD